MSAPDPTVLWRADADAVERSNLVDFMAWLAKNRGLTFADYGSLWRWSVEELEDFWAAVWQYYGLDRVSSYDAVLPDSRMPGAVWFSGARINFAERCLHHPSPHGPALVSVDEDGAVSETSWEELRAQVAALARWLRDVGVQPGDRVAACLPNTPHTVVALLATAAVGAVWTVCAPDFGTPSVLSRLSQAEPAVLFVVDGYRHGGKRHDRRAASAQIVAALPSLRHVVVIDALGTADTMDLGDQPTGPTRHPWGRCWPGPLRWSSPTSRSITRCGSCGPPVPPACPRALSRATAA